MTHTNTQQKAPGAANSKGLMTDTNKVDFASHGPINQALDGNKITSTLIAAYARLTGAASVFDLMFALLAVQFGLIV